MNVFVSLTLAWDVKMELNAKIRMEVTNALAVQAGMESIAL